MHPDDWRFIRMHPDVIGTRTADPVTSGLSANLASASHTFPIMGTLANDFAFLLMLMQRTRKLPWMRQTKFSSFRTMREWEA